MSGDGFGTALFVMPGPFKVSAVPASKNLVVPPTTWPDWSASTRKTAQEPRLTKSPAVLASVTSAMLDSETVENSPETDSDLMVVAPMIGTSMRMD